MADLDKAMAEAEFARIPIDQLNIDHSYQRELHMRLVQRVAANWNPVSGEPILVSKRKGGKHYIVNGQHRASAAKIIGKTDILCRVVAGLAVKDEAALRLQTNVQVGERPNERFKAQLAAENQESWAILRAINGAGVELNLDRINPLAGINAITTIEGIYRIDRGQTLEQVMTTLAKHYKEVNSQTGSQPVLRALSWFYVRHNDEFSDESLSKTLKEVGPAAWAKQSKDMQSLMGGALWLNTYRVLIEAYNNHAPKGMELKMQTRGSSRMPKTEEVIED
jgi:hypothetical protein